MLETSTRINEKHARSAARILRMTATLAVSEDECVSIADFTSRLMYGDSVDYSLLMSAQNEFVQMGGSSDLFDEIRNDLVH